MKENVKRLRRENPEFEYHLYDDKMCRKFIKTHFDKDVVFAFDKLKPGAYKADLWRYCVLYIHGGIYLDIKMKCVNGFRLIHLTDKEYWVEDRIVDGSKGIWQGLISIKPNNNTLKLAIHKVVENVWNDCFSGVLSITGPQLIAQFFDVINEKYKFNVNNNLSVIKLNKSTVISSYSEYRDEYIKKPYSFMYYTCDVYNYPILESILIVNFTRTMEKNGTIFYTSTPSILKTNEGFIMNQRWVNYLYDTNGRKKYIPKQWVTINSVLYLDDSLKQIGDEIFLEEHEDNLARKAIGLEDIRLFSFDKNTYFIGNKMGKIHYGIYDNPLFTINVPSKHVEKNWSFVQFNDELHVVHSWYPLKIGKLDNNKLQIIKTTDDMPLFFENARGGTPGIKYHDEIWFILHKSMNNNMKVYNYQHFFAVFDNNMRLLRYSQSFKFKGEKVEYCTGMVIVDDILNISFSALDSQSFIGNYRMRDVNKIRWFVTEADVNDNFENCIYYMWNFKPDEENDFFTFNEGVLNNNKQYINDYKLIEPNNIEALFVDTGHISLFPKLQQLYSLIPKWVTRADLARLLIIYTNGGTYSDVDCFIQKKINMEKHNVSLFVERICKLSELGPRESKNNGNEVRVANYFFYSKVKHHPFLKDVINECLLRLEQILELEKNNEMTKSDILWCCGPDVITTVYHSTKNKYKDIKLFDNSYLTHKCYSSWR